MSEELLTFYRTYLAWLEAGAPEGEPFTRCTGLCSNLYDFYDMGKANDTNLYWMKCMSSSTAKIWLWCCLSTVILESTP